MSHEWGKDPGPLPPRRPVIVEGPPPPPEQQFKGHPQPPIQDRLQEAFNFLADEDPNRCLGFGEKLAEIDEYLAHIKDENFLYDEKLYRDVKIMAETHHEWEERVQKGWIDTSCGTKPLIQPVSNRLLTGSQVEELRREQEAMGVEEQMRDEDPPFTTERKGEYVGFIRALGTDSKQDPDLVDDGTNLLFVEGRAYDWAVREPAWIPYWMHPTQGIPKEPIKTEDEEPWYQKELHGNTGRTLGRPPRQTLPELLQKREREVNLLLAKGDRRTDEEINRLETLLSNHFPKGLQQRAKVMRSQQDNIVKKKVQAVQELEDMKMSKKQSTKFQQLVEQVDIIRADLETKTKIFLECARVWYKWLQKSGGVQCIVESGDENIQEAYPETLGVLVFPEETLAADWYTEMVSTVNNIYEKAENDPFYWDSRSPQSGLQEFEFEALEYLLYFLPNPPGLEQDKKMRLYGRYQYLDRASRLDYDKLLERKRKAITDFCQLNIKNVEMRPPWGETVGIVDGTLYVPFEESVESYDHRRAKKKKRKEMARSALESEALPPPKEVTTSVDHTPQAERRGIQRAAIELGLNLLCGNHEQHRPDDKFRIVQLPGPYVDWTDIPEVPLTIPLDPSHRPLELEPFHFTEKVARYRKQKDFEYQIARTKATYQRRGLLDPPVNFRGPFTVATIEQFHETIKKANDDYITIYHQMGTSNKEAPRPLMTRLLDVVDQGIRWNGEPHPLVDPRVPLTLTNEQLALLQEIAGTSWDTEELTWELAEICAPTYDMAKLEEFRHDIQDMEKEFPLWDIDPKPPIPLFEDKNFQETFEQTRHEAFFPSKQGMPLKEVLQKINNKRLADKAPVWNERTAKEYCQAMRAADMIHYDNKDGEEKLSQIPFQGHPENKYIISLDSLSDKPTPLGLYLNDDEPPHWEVQYDVEGVVGPPIVQPNKYQYFQQLAMNLGRLIKDMLDTIATYDGDYDAELNEQLNGIAITEDDFMQNLKSDEVSQYYPRWGYGSCAEINQSGSLKDIALELHIIAPDIAEKAQIEFEDNKPENITEQQAAILLQIQILEESNNNWESRFPENEHVWDFAASRLIPSTQELVVGGEKIHATFGPRKYFNMRRYPVGCQTEATQLAIKSSGPAVAQKSDAQIVKQPEPERPGEIYRGGNGPPFFPFGETPYQEAFQSWRMQQEMADIPEFQTKGGKDQPPPGRFIPVLPELPSNFVPVSITPHENRMKEIQELMKLPNAPDPNILENYYTQEEIMNIKRREAFQQRQRELKEVHDFIAQRAGKEFKEMTRQEIEKVCAENAIDPFEMRMPVTKPREERTTKRRAATEPTTQTRSSKRPRRGPAVEFETDEEQTGESFTEGTGDEVTGGEETTDDQTGDSFMEGTGDEVTGEETIADDVTGEETVTETK